MVTIQGADGKMHDCALKILPTPAPSLAELCKQYGIKATIPAKTFYFKFAREVNEFKAAVAEDTARDCMQDLGLSRVEIRWVEPGTPSDYAVKGTPGPDYSELQAFTKDGVLYLDANIDLDVLKSAVRHECRHLYHSQWETKHGVARPEREAEEIDCCTYAVSRRRWG